MGLKVYLYGVKGIRLWGKGIRLWGKGIRLQKKQQELSEISISKASKIAFFRLKVYVYGVKGIQTLVKLVTSMIEYGNILKGDTYNAIRKYQ